MIKDDAISDIHSSETGKFNMKNKGDNDKMENEINDYKPEFKKVMVCACVRCGHKWHAKSDKKPVSCAHCGSKNWWIAAGQLKSQSVLKPNKYGMDKLGIGDSVFLPFLFDASGNNDQKAITARRISIRGYAKRSGRQFYMDGTYKDGKSGLFIKRVL